jgi:hypothetical protein
LNIFGSHREVHGDALGERQVSDDAPIREFEPDLGSLSTSCASISSPISLMADETRQHEWPGAFPELATSESNTAAIYSRGDKCTPSGMAAFGMSICYPE